MRWQRDVDRNRLKRKAVSQHEEADINALCKKTKGVVTNVGRGYINQPIAGYVPMKANSKESRE